MAWVRFMATIMVSSQRILVSMIWYIVACSNVCSCATEAGTEALARILNYAADIRAVLRQNQGLNQAELKKMVPTVVIVENLHPELKLRRHAVDASLAHDASMAARHGYGREVLHLGADAFATVEHQQPGVLAGFVLYRLVKEHAEVTLREDHAEQQVDYLIITWTPAGASRSFYSAEFVRAGSLISPSDAACHYSLLLFTVLSRAERGHRVRRELRNDLSARKPYGQDPNVTSLIGYMSPEKQPILSIQVGMARDQVSDVVIDADLFLTKSND
jgi:hypothetical protein